MIAECRGEVVSDPAEADYVFDDTYVQKPSEPHEDGTVEAEQTIIRSWELEKLVKFVNS
jgi:hypothetical protein